MTEIAPSLTAGVVRETFPGERRVALVPASAGVLEKSRISVIVETGAGVEAGFPDSAYAEAGATIVATRAEVFAKADIIAQVRTAGANAEMFAGEREELREGQYLIGLCDPLGKSQLMSDLATRKVSCFALELLPRITRAQSMDVLSSMASIAGYKSVLLAAATLPRMFPMMMTAAGTITPAKVLIVGAGVAGLQAIATARRLGAVVQAYDIRPAVKEEVISLGAKFVELDLKTSEQGQSGGYAQEMDEDFYRRQRELMGKVVGESNVVITTAAVPGKQAPVLVTTDMIRKMAPGSVVIDLAAEQGGNCELTRPNETIVEHGVTIVGCVNLPATIPYHASQMYAKNMATFLKNLVRDGEVQLNQEDEIICDTLVTHGGDVVNSRVRELLQLPPLAAVEQPAE